MCGNLQFANLQPYPESSEEDGEGHLSMKQFLLINHKIKELNTKTADMPQ